MWPFRPRLTGEEIRYISGLAHDGMVFAVKYLKESNVDKAIEQVLEVKNFLGTLHKAKCVERRFLFFSKEVPYWGEKEEEDEADMKEIKDKIKKTLLRIEELINYLKRISKLLLTDQIQKEAIEKVYAVGEDVTTVYKLLQ